MKKNNTVLVIGGAGYVGTTLVPRLLKKGYNVIVYDIFWFTDETVFDDSPNRSSLKLIRGDIRDLETLKESIRESDSIIHLACISNDPSFDLNPSLGKSINHDSFEPIVKLAKKEKVERFIFASSSSVYGVKEDKNITEDLELTPLTDYSKYKAICEETLLKYCDQSFCCTILRPATVCGYSPRQRLDVVVNILTNHAVNNGKIKIYNGQQLRPNIHIKDMCDAYIATLEAPKEIINSKVYNVGGENLSVKDISDLVSLETGVKEVLIEKNSDIRSYHISSNKFRNDLKLLPKHTVKDAIRELHIKFKEKHFKNPLTNPAYFNVLFLKNNEDL